jgi:hypothetical protein
MEWPGMGHLSGCLTSWAGPIFLLRVKSGGRSESHLPETRGLS